MGGPEGKLSDLSSGGTASLASGRFGQAIDTLDAASSQILDARTRAGAFEKYTIDSTERVLDSMEENLTGAVGFYDTDVALEASNLVRSRILFQSAVAALKTTEERYQVVSGLLGGK